MASLQEFVRQAQAQGYSEQEIQAFLAQQGVGQQPTVQPTAETQPSDGGLVRSVGKFATDVGKSLISPFVTTAKNIGTAAITVPQAAVSQAVGAVNPQLGAKIAAQDILGTQKRAAEVSEDTDKALREQIAASLQIGAYAVPFGKGGNILTRAVLPGASVGTLTSEDTANLIGNLALGGKDEEVNVEDIAGSAILGGAIPVGLEALSGIGSRIFGKGAKETGRALQKGVLKPQVRVGPSEFLDEERLLSESSRLGIKGTGSQMKRQVSELYTQFSDDLGTAVKGASIKGRPVTASSVRDKVMQNVKENIVIETSAQERLITNIFKKIGLAAKKGNLGPEDFAQLNRNVSGAPGSRLSRAMDQIRKGGTITEADQAYLSAYEVINNLFKQKVPGVEGILRDMSVLHQLAPGISKAAEETMRIPIIGARVPSGSMQSVKSATGRLLEGTGEATEAVSKALGGTIPKVTRQMVPQTLIRKAVEGGGEVPVTATPEEEVATQLLTQQQQTEVPTITGYTPNELAQGYANALKAGDTKAANTLKLLLGLEQDMSKQKIEGSAASALNVVNELEDMFGQVQKEGLTAQGPGILSRVKGQVTGKVASLRQTSPTATTYDTQKKAFISLVVRGLGEKGVLTDQDVKRVVDAIPDFGTSAEVAQLQWKTIRSILSKAALGETTVSPTEVQVIQ